MSDKTNISPLVENIEMLNESDVKILLLMYHAGGWMEPDELSILTGLHARTVKKSLERHRVRQLIKQIDRKSELDRLLIRHRQELQRLKKNEFDAAEVPKTGS